MTDILNSPVSVLVVFLIITAIIFYRKMSGADRRCGVCNTGLMEETSARPEKFVDGSSASTTSTAWVLYTVEYKCSNCDNKLVRTENRR